ncbi:hypothetical protein SIM12_20730, partial [Xanthomonas campestris pv. incanae]|uniref:hypothetical protein n=1 Tax=Xanthomonas campestris TaxID=339 RepID=UPI0029C2A673
MRLVLDARQVRVRTLMHRHWSAPSKQQMKVRAQWAPQTHAAHGMSRLSGTFGSRFQDGGEREGSQCISAGKRATTPGLSSW